MSEKKILLRAWCFVLIVIQKYENRKSIRTRSIVTGILKKKIVRRKFLAVILCVFKVE